MTIRRSGERIFTGLHGMGVDWDGLVAPQPAAEPLTSHVAVVSLQLGAEKPQPWGQVIARLLTRNLPAITERCRLDWASTTGSK